MVVEQLPIDPLLPEAVAALRAGPALVVEAPPGAGKTTRLPPALLAAGLAGGGEVVVLEPRRLAARMAARRVAAELGERPGETVGWQVRFEDVSGPRTRLRFVTEALLTRRLLSAPELPGVGAVVLDEFHERHLDGDLALALLRRLLGRRRDLKLVVMSATLDAGPVARFLGAPALRSEGRAFPVTIEHLGAEEAARELRLEARVASAVRRVLREEPDGHVLVFLPGAAEIRRAREALAGLEAADVLPLHGELPPEEQDRAVAPSARRKVILATNVAETSVTIEGVVAVVDSGLARVAAHSPWSGLPTLALRKVSRASAAQRAGRAGRTRPGRCLRLYTRHDHDARPEFDQPEIRREDLAETALALASLGVVPDAAFWLDAPLPAAWAAAQALLRDLRAVDGGGAITELGRRLARLPLHPRLGRLLVAAGEAGAGREGALVAALLGERDIRASEAGRFSAGPGAAARRDVPTGPSDLLELASLFEEAARARFGEGALRRLGLAPGAVQAVERARRQLERHAGRGPSPSPRGAGGGPGGGAGASEDALLRATLAAFPDRVARRRAPGSDEVVLAGGGSARLAAESAVREAPLLVAVDAEERRAHVPGRPPASGAVVRLASAVTPELLLDLFPEALRYEDEVRWDAAAERADGFERLVYRDLVLEETRAPRPDPERAAAVLFEAARARGARAFAAEGALDRLLARLAFAARHAPEAARAAPSEEALDDALREACQGRRSFAELREVGLDGALLARLGPAARAAVERLAPERVTLPGGRSVRIQYQAGDEPPWIESRLQDFFGLADGPRVAQGRVPLVLHLLAPNGRAQQVTTDLAGFWERHYPALRRELMRRYPRHAWPEDPLRAEPPQARRR